MNFYRLIFLFLILSAAFTGCKQEPPANPNVIFILTDDQGYGDLACHGNPWIKTPALDELHASGVRFTNFHVGTTCAPTRSGLMSGRYCNKVGVWHTINGREILDPRETTLAERMHAAGYATAMFGKWHLGDGYPFRPQDRGFDETLIHGGGGVGQQPDFWNNDYFDDTYFRNGTPEKFEGYCTDVWFEEAIDFIQKNQDKPFFCYIATNAPHGPFHVDQKYIDMYSGNEQIPNPNFYGMITNIDENLAKLRQVLNELDIAKNTILVFMTDNGTSSGVRFGKEGEVLSGFNAGMRGVKGSPYDGGHRVPFFIHWPGGKINKGKDIDVVTSYVDFVPTILDLCGIPWNDNDFDGTSLTPLIRKSGADWPDRILFTDTQREEFLVKYKQFAAMTNQWRLVGKDELYDIAADPGQQNNVAAQHPDVVKRLMDAYEVWWQDVSQNAGLYHSPVAGTAHENLMRLNSHDFHTETGMPAWSQEQVRRGGGVNGFWSVEIAEPGTYEIELCRWPKESGLTFRDAAPEGDSIPGGKPYSEGVVFDYTEARIKVGEQELSRKIGPDDQQVSFTLELGKGKTTIQSWMKTSDGEEKGAFYAYIRKL